MSDEESDEDPDQPDEELAKILRKLAPWRIKNTNVHRGTSKRVYVKRRTNTEPKNPWAYLTSRFQSMKKPGTLEKEHKYSLYLHFTFPDLIVPEYPINANNKPLTNILNSKRGLLITKKNIVESIEPGYASPYDTVQLLHFMMTSTDQLIHNGFANLDLKPANIGIIGGLRINDNDANMFYPIPDKYKEHYRDAIKLVGLCTLSNFGLDKTMFDANRELYPNINYKRALELCVKFKKEDEDEIREYAKEKMSNVHVDGKDEDLSSLFDGILFPEQLVTWYGGKYVRDNFIGKLRTMGLISDEEREQNERHAERERHAEAERQGNLEFKKNRNNPATSKRRKPDASNGSSNRRANGSSNRRANRRANGSARR